MPTLGQARAGAKNGLDPLLTRLLMRAGDRDLPPMEFVQQDCQLTLELLR